MDIKNIGLGIVPFTPVPFSGKDNLIAWGRLSLFGLSALALYSKNKRLSYVLVGCSAVSLLSSLSAGAWKNKTDNSGELVKEGIKKDLDPTKNTGGIVGAGIRADPNYTIDPITKIPTKRTTQLDPGFNIDTKRTTQLDPGFNIDTKRTTQLDPGFNIDTNIQEDSFHESFA